VKSSQGSPEHYDVTVLQDQHREGELAAAEEGEGGEQGIAQFPANIFTLTKPFRRQAQGRDVIFMRN
jgi:hypothetical protein